MTSEFGVIAILLLLYWLQSPSGNMQMVQDAEGKEKMCPSYGYSDPFLDSYIFASPSSLHNSSKRT